MAAHHDRGYNGHEQFGGQSQHGHHLTPGGFAANNTNSVVTPRGAPIPIITGNANNNSNNNNSGGGGGGGSSAAMMMPVAPSLAALVASAATAPSRTDEKTDTNLLKDIKIALICQSNLNRSMEAHALLLKKGYAVRSFGAGTKVRLPGETPYKPNVYDFGTLYDHIFNDLKKKNAARYQKNGMLNMLERNRKVKAAPQRWQDEKEHFDLILTYETRVYETVIADIEARNSADVRACHIINIDTIDSHAEASNGATASHQLVDMLYRSSDWEDNIVTILDTFEKDTGKQMLHTLAFY